MKLSLKALVVSVVLVGVVGCGGAETCPDAGCQEGVEEVGDVQQVQETACPVNSPTCNPGEYDPPEVKMPTSANAGMSSGTVYSRVGGGYMQEVIGDTMTSTKRRWTYCAKRCADGLSWCLSDTAECRPYSINFDNGVLTKAFAQVAIRVGLLNGSTSTRQCWLSSAFTDEDGVSGSHTFVNGTLSPGQQVQGTFYMQPGPVATLRAYCHSTAGVSIEYAESMQTYVFQNDATWRRTYSVANGHGAMEVAQ